jgi:hypothetical protein
MQNGRTFWCARRVQAVCRRVMGAPEARLYWATTRLPAIIMAIPW